MTRLRTSLIILGHAFALTALIAAQSLLAGPASRQQSIPYPSWFNGISSAEAGAILIIPGIVLLAVSAWSQRKTRVPDSAITRRTAVILLIILIALAIPIKLYHLPEIPLGAHNDEIVKGMQVIGLLKGDAFRPFYIANKEFLFFYMLVPFVWLGGPTIGALRALPFLCGLATVFFAWHLFRRLWGSVVAWTATGFLAVGLWPGQSCHICERLNAAPLFTTATLFFLLTAVQSRKVIAWIATGVAMACGMWTFPTFRLIPAAVGGYIVWSLLRRDLTFRSDGVKILLMLAVFFLLVTAPLGFDVGEMFTVFYTRHEHDFKIARTPDQIVTYVRQLAISFNVDSVQDMSFTSIDAPVIWWPLGAFFTAGLVILLIRLPQTDAVFGLVWLIAALLPALVSEPAVRRLTAVQPLVFGLVGLGLWSILHSILPFIKRSKVLIFSLTGLMIGATGVRNFEEFRHGIAPEWKVAREDFRIVQAAIDNSDRYEIHLDWIEEEAELPYRYLTYPATGNLDYFVAEPPRYSIPFRFVPEKDILYLFRNIPENSAMNPLLTGLYPDGVLLLHQDENYPRGYYSFTMTRDALQARRGVSLEIPTLMTGLSPDGPAPIGTSIPLQTASLNRQAISPEFESIMAGSRWVISGVLLADRTSRHDLMLSSNSDTVFSMDGREMIPSAILPGGQVFSEMLTMGPHRIDISMISRFQGVPELELLWQEPSAAEAAEYQSPWVPVPNERWLKLPLPPVMPSPVATEKAGFQYRLEQARQYPHPNGDRSYDIARIQALPDGTFIGNSWHYQRMVVLDAGGEMIREWNANLQSDPNWMLRFDFDVSADGNVCLTGDTRSQLLIASPKGALIRRIDLPATPVLIDADTDTTALILCPGNLYRISLVDGSVLTRHRFLWRERGSNSNGRLRSLRIGTGVFMLPTVLSIESRFIVYSGQFLAVDSSSGTHG